VQKTYIQYIFFFLLSVLIISCSGEDGSSFFKPKRISPPSLEDRISLSQSENLGRSSWQKPTFIVSKLGELEGKTIADIGSGTGYFTFHLAFMNAKVIAVDIDQEMLNFIDSFKSGMNSDMGTIETRIAEPNNPKLKAEEVDKALIVNTIGYIDNLSDYLSTLKLGIKKGGILVISDYKAPDSHVPAPTADKIVSLIDLEADLKKAGYVDIQIDDTTLEYQYVVTASIPK